MSDLPRPVCRDDTVHGADYYTADQMRSMQRELIARLEAAEDSAARWEALYRRAVNEANGLTNYVEDRPELSSAERRLEAIQRDARLLRGDK